MKRKRLDIMLPVYSKNLKQIKPSIKKQIKFYNKNLVEYQWQIIFAVNGPNVRELKKEIHELSHKDKRVSYTHTDIQGKGAGLMHAWSQSEADILSYMDIDLSTDLNAFPSIINAIEKGSDFAISSRFLRNSKVKRSFIRKIVSIGYHMVFMKIILNAKKYSDGQCGMKAFNKRVKKQVLPLVKNRSWFFESEMLYVAEKKGFQITELPVKWEESGISGLSLLSAITEFIIEGSKLRFRKL